MTRSRRFSHRCSKNLTSATSVFYVLFCPWDQCHIAAWSTLWLGLCLVYCSMVRLCLYVCSGFYFGVFTSCSVKHSPRYKLPWLPMPQHYSLLLLYPPHPFSKRHRWRVLNQIPSTHCPPAYWVSSACFQQHSTRH